MPLTHRAEQSVTKIDVKTLQFLKIRPARKLPEPPCGAPVHAPSHPPPREAPIRTLGVSLIAIAAVVASLTIARQRQEEPARDKEKRPEHSPAAVDLDLERLRAAGF
jgi:hypothetical protein